MNLTMTEVSITKTDTTVEVWSGMTVQQGIAIAASALLESDTQRVQLYEIA
jgi:hypothetical protein